MAATDPRAAPEVRRKSSPVTRQPRLARHSLLGFALAGLGGLAFAGVALILRRNGRLVKWDAAASQAVHTRAVRQSLVVLTLVKICAALGREGALLLTLLLGGYWLRRRRWRQFVMLVVGVIGGNTWFLVLSRAFKRPRPIFPDPLHRVDGPGFPSGHSMTAVTLYGLILSQVWPRLGSERTRRLAALGAGLAVFLVGFSRLFLGDHYPLDVLGGYSFGLFWGALSYTLLERVAPHRYA